MTRAGNIIISTLMWCAIVAYIVAATHLGREKRASITVQALSISIVDTAASKVITAEKVTRWLAEAGIDPIGRPVDSADTRTIERTLGARPEVKRVSAWSDLGGTLTVRLEPRTPAMRILTAGGYRFWFTDDGYILRDRGDFTAYVPVVTGNITFPFPPSAEGSYLAMVADNYNDFLERFTDLEAERRTLRERLAATRADIRTARADTPKRWWSKSRKDDFYLGKAARIAGLEAQRAEIVSSLAGIDKLERSLREKEKKSYQSHRFLSKLANFVGFIGRERFWSSQIVQIHATGGGNESGGGNGNAGGNESGGGSGNETVSVSTGGATAAGEWRELQLELIPRAGNHVILLGELDGTERQRLENLRLFYAEGLWHEGWDEYGYINIKYGNQIVCTK